jgi:cobalt-precorrin 5A hydrolase
VSAFEGLVAGFGCRHDCPEAQVWALLHHALLLIGARPEELQGLATFERRAQERGLLAVAQALALPLVGYDTPTLTSFEPQLSHRSAVSWRHTGCYGIAESAALSHCGDLYGGVPRLVVTRLHNAYATVALASPTPR